MSPLRHNVSDTVHYTHLLRQMAHKLGTAKLDSAIFAHI